MRRDWEYLSKDAFSEIAAFLDAHSLSRLSCVCKSWKSLAEDQELWWRLARYQQSSFTQFSSRVQAQSSFTDAVDWKRVFRDREIKWNRVLAKRRSFIGWVGWTWILIGLLLSILCFAVSHAIWIHRFLLTCKPCEAELSGSRIVSRIASNEDGEQFKIYSPEVSYKVKGFPGISNKRVGAFDLDVEFTDFDASQAFVLEISKSSLIPCVVCPERDTSFLLPYLPSAPESDVSTIQTSLLIEARATLRCTIPTNLLNKAFLESNKSLSLEDLPQNDNKTDQSRIISEGKRIVWCRHPDRFRN